MKHFNYGIDQVHLNHHKPVGINGEMEVEYHGIKISKGREKYLEKIMKDNILMRSFRTWFVDM